MGKQDNLKMLVLALGLLSLTGLAQAGEFDDEFVSTTAFGTSGMHEQIINSKPPKSPPKGHAHGRCKEDKKDKKNKPCASPS